MSFQQLGPYQIARKLGRGGMGVVYEGIDAQTGRKAAVKVLSAALSEEEDFRSRFEAEIETLRKLNHPNIVRLFGFGQHQGHLFYAMELVDGSSLESELRAGRRFDWREVTQIGIQTCRGLRHAHDRGVIHRDIKPGNLLVAGDGTVKLSDFGIARLFGKARLTSAGSVVGTVEYMAPEQAEGRPVDHRADLYSLGGVLYSLLAQRPPFRAQSFAEMVQKQRTAQPEPVSHYAPDVPGELEQIISGLLEKDPDKRISTATVLSRRLEAMVGALTPELDEQAEQPGERDFDLGVRGLPGGPPDADQLPPTRAMDDDLDDDVDEPPGDVQPPLSASQLPPTKPLSRVRRPDPAWHETETVEEEPAAEQEPEPDTHFTPVAAEELDRYPAENDHPALISPQTWALAIGLIAVGLGVWYLLQPPSADHLHEKIMDNTRDGTIQSLRAAEGDIAEFLTRFSDDSRAGELRDLEREIDLDRLERRFELRASGRISAGTPLLPCELAYLEAISYVRLDQERGMARLQALIDLYEHGADPFGPTGKCLELARRRLERLRAKLDQRSPGQLAMVVKRLDRADQLARTHPKTARQMRQAVVELYGDKPWAAEAVARARAALLEEPDDAVPAPKIEKR